MNTNTIKEAATNTHARTVYNWTALDSAVVRQLGFNEPEIDGDRVTIEEEAAEELENVARCSFGAAGGFGGFIYYSETWKFFRANRDAIREELQDMAENIGDGCAVELVRGFNSFKSEKLSADDVGRVLWGDPPEKWEECRNAAGEWVSGRSFDPFAVANACAFFALEETANKWTNAEIN